MSMSGVLLTLGASDHVIDGLADVARKQTDEVRRLKARVMELEQESVRRLADLKAFQSQVRDLIVAKVEDGSVCVEGANEALMELGLQQIEQKYEVEVEVELYPMRVTVQVLATGEDDAHDKVSSGQVDDEIQREVLSALDDSWSRPEIRDWSVNEVTKV